MTWALTDDERYTFEAALRSRMGTPWRHMGRSGCGYGHQTGLDCIGLMIYAAQAVGRKVADLAHYERDPDGTLEARITAHLGAPAASVGPGQLALLRLPRRPRHVAYIANTDGGLTLIHSYAGGRKQVTEHALDADWLARIVRSWTL